MYHKLMTIKRRLFISNVRMVLISFVTITLTTRIMGFFTFGTGRPDRETVEKIIESYSYERRMLMWVLGLLLFIILISLINNFFTHRMTSRIVKSLEPLNEGVRQIHGNNFTYRIGSQNNDEFRPICDAFDEMAAKLETSTLQRKKDEVNRRELIAGISHDLRTPLTSIKGYIEGIEKGVASDDQTREKYFAIIKNKTADLEHIIEQLFLFSKLDMDEFPLASQCVDFAAVVSDMTEEFIAEYLSRGLTIKLDGIPKNIFVNIDVLMFRNVLINILENSVKYKTGEQGQIEISAVPEENFVLLRLADDGPGVQPDMLPKLFDVFYRTDPSRSRRGSGTAGSGLGLAISMKIIERMGGKIHAELPANGGLAVVIRLPLLQGEKS